MKELEKTCNAVYSLRYHLILCVKYRRDCFVDERIRDRFKELSLTVASTQGVEVIEQECGDDHVHLLISTKPSTSLTTYINYLKTYSSRMLRKEFPEEIRKKLWGDAFWSPSYYLSTVGNVSLDTLYRYVEGQRKEKD